MENNPVFSGRTSGTLNRLFSDRIVRACNWAAAPTETRINKEEQKKVVIEGEVDSGDPALNWNDLRSGKRKFFLVQGDSVNLDIPENFVDFVVTDPPYYDSVQYSDLSNFFRVWLQRLLPQEANWQYNQLASAVSEGDSLGNRKYGGVLTGIWKTCRRALKKDAGRLVFTFHHWRHHSWAELTLSLKRARFWLLHRYVVFSENPISVHIMGLNALKHDCILVLSPLEIDDQVNKWSKPSEISTKDSYQFCCDCGAALGWFLMSDITEDEIRGEWKRLLGGNENGKTSG